MVVQHRARAKHGNADALSRELFVDDCEGYLLGRGLEHLPCGVVTTANRQKETEDILWRMLMTWSLWRN
ncbi:hypothetical protein DPMN_035678 [Dreissena polymorpha]|uniref:Uncharacterized protein n=1 Tax=Dreissena polymorpha TaxID=45954 RepID=A0A9D4RN53_DREPO|nr:hypothetical protein DPMN_035678 [Dreissena polymorpha]